MLTPFANYDAPTGILAQRKGIVVRRHTPPGSYQSSQCNAVSGYAKDRSLRVTGLKNELSAFRFDV